MWSTCACALLILANVVYGDQRYGDCSNVHAGELIWQFRVRRTPNAMPFQIVEAEYGPTQATISCIDVASIGEDGAVARITSGGVGTNHVNFTFVTSRGKPIGFKVLVYGH